MKSSLLLPEDFIRWRRRLGMSQDAVASRLGISTSSVSAYESGKRKEGEVKIPLLVALGMAAISSNITPYKGDKE